LTPAPPADVNRLQTLGKLLAESDLFPDTRAMAQAVVKVLAGQELGFGPVASMTGVYVVKGRITLSANLIAAAIRRSGRYDYRLKRLDDNACEIEFVMGGTAIGTSVFTIDDARKAGLAGGDSWRKYPRNMLFARAISNGAKWYCPDVFAGAQVYTPEELGAEVDGETGQVLTLRPFEEIATPGAQAAGPPPHEELLRLVRRKGVDLGKLLAHYGAETPADLSPDQSEDALAILNNKPDIETDAAGTSPAADDNYLLKENSHV
jgi:hypothetical protein